MSKPPNIKIRGIRSSIPSGYVLGRSSLGTGDVELIDTVSLAGAIIDTGLVSAPGAVTGLTAIATARVLGNTSGSSAVPSAQALTAPAAGLTIASGSSAFTFAFANDLAALEGLSSTGLAARTGTDTWAQRTITGTAADISVTNGDGVSGNPTIDLIDTAVTPASYTNTNLTVDAKGRITTASSGTGGGGGTVSSVALAVPASSLFSVSGSPVTTSGTLTVATTGTSGGIPYFDTTATLNTSALLTNHAPIIGAGAGAAPKTVAAMTDGQVLIGSTSADPVPATITAGSNVTVTNAAGSITIAASGGGGGTVAAAFPQGRLTLRSGEPVMLNDKSAATTIYYDSFLGNLYPNWSGSAMANITITGDEISCGLDAGTPHVASGKLYDIYGTASATIGTNATAWLNSYQAVTGATNATPIVITANSHGLANGDVVFISQVQGNTAANGRWVVANQTANTFELTGSVGNATYTSATGGLASRGDAAELQLKLGVWTNKNAMTHVWGGASGTTDLGSIAANEGTYLGTLYATAAGQTAMQFLPASASGGSNNFLGLYNAYNRVKITSIERDSHTSWTDATTSWRSADNNNNTRVTYVDGLAQSPPAANYTCGAQSNSNNYTAIAIGFNTTTAPNHMGLGDYDNATVLGSLTVSDNSTPIAGLVFVQALEAVLGGTLTYSGQLMLTTSMAVLTVSVDM